MNVAELIEFLKTQPQDLPVAYALHSEYCLLELDDIEVVNWRDPICVISWSEWGEWHDWSGVHPFRSATHWRPLPDPPQDSPTPPDPGHERG